ncbi:hypothetical protein PIB30_035948 [Stylosanthes scabra]|uniref:Glycosyltransferase n=1 Tax=Stylosanthes scabra TaxID=79078 RepID=A0ABU6QDA9_9FABA|nr:hypothetical protein [Stylosanthes scabra]
MLKKRMGSSAQQHVLLFPFMAKGHTIPLLQFGRILLNRHVAVTVITTPANRPFVEESLAGTAASVVTIPFTSTAVPGVESTDKLPSMSLFYNFALSTVSMQPHFEQALEALPRVSFMVTDGFLWWTLQSANIFKIRRLAFTGMSSYCMSLCRVAAVEGIFSGPQPKGELVELTQFTWIRMCKDDVETEFRNREAETAAHEFNTKMMETTMNSYGVVENSFYELQPAFVDYLNSNSSYKTWCLGPFCLAAQQPKKIYRVPDTKPRWIRWLDEKLEQKCSVLYVSFGSQPEVSLEQLEELAVGLEESSVSFLWVITKKNWDLPEGFEERVKSKGMVVREWVDQREILMHESMKGFLSHCGWNSVLESVCAGVPILAWPLAADQHLNAKMVDEEIRVGLRVETSDGSLRGFVKREGLKKTVRELMEGEKRKEAMKKVGEWACMAIKAVEEGGSSWSSLEFLLQETSV